MNFDGELKFPENEFQFKSSWVGVTPIKPTPGRTQRPIYVDERGNQLGRSNWQEQVGLPCAYALEMQNYNGSVPNFNNQNMLLGLDGCLPNRNVNLSSNQDAGLTNQNASLFNPDASLSNRDGVLSNRDISLLHQNVILSNHDLCLLRRDNVLSNRDLSLVNQDTGLSNQNASLLSQNVRFSNSNIGLSNRNVGFSNQNAGLSTQEAGLSNHSAGLSNRVIFSNQNAGLTNWNVGLSNQNVSLTNRNAGYSNRNTGFSNQNTDLLNLDDAFSIQNTGLTNRHEGLSEHNVRFPNQNNSIPNRDANQNTSLSIQDVGFSSQNTGSSNRYPGLSNPEHFPNQNTGLSDWVVGLPNQNVRLSNGNVGLPQRSRVVNQIANTYAQTLDYENSGMNTITLADILTFRKAARSTATSAINRSIHVRSMQQAPNLQAQPSNHQYQSSSIGISPVNNSHCQSTSALNSSNFANIPQDGFPQLNRPQYNLNLPPTSVNEATNSSISNSFYYTPDQTNNCDKNQHPKFLNFSVEENLSHERNKQDNREVSSIRNEATEKNNDELWQNVVHSSPVAITSIKETNKDGGHGIDLNKTPQQKTPKRRKHRPKVVREGKSKRVPKPVVPPDSSTKKSPTGKRKYVRKTDLKSTPPKENAMGKNVDHPVGNAAKSSRRVLNFDMDKMTDESNGHLESKTNEIENGNERCINLNMNAREMDLCRKTDKMCGQKSAEQMNQYNGVLERETQEITRCSNSHFRNQMLNSCVALPNRWDTQAPATVLRNMSVNNLNSIMSIANTKHSDPRHTSQSSGYGPVYPEQIHAEGLGQIFFQPKKTDDNLDQSGKMMLQSSPQSVLHNMIDSSDERTSKRKYQPTMDHINPDTISFTSLLCQEIINVDEYDKVSSNLGKEFSDTRKRRSGSEHNTNLSTFMYSINDAEDCLRQQKTNGANGVDPNLFTSQINHGGLSSHFEISSTPKRVSNGVNTFPNEQYHSPAQNGFVKQYYSPELVSHTPSAVQMQSNRSTQVHNINSMDEKCNYVPLPPSKRAPTSDDMKGVGARSLNISAKKTKATLTCLPSSKAIIPVDRNVSHNAPSKNTKRGRLERKDCLIHIEQIISRFESLKLDDKSNGSVGKEQKALVPYKAAGTIIPYEGYQVKKRKPRPKVNLDPETERLWKLLMGKEQSEASEGTDKDKEKWWEEERRVFRGRADSFIARMHLVQGDRRFSRWKGSVVDSVIGVFLTQNVSDHLSSSAFISLAARFPITSSSNNKACYKSEKPILVEEPDDTPRQYEKASSQLVYSQIPSTSQEMLEQKRRNPTLGPQRTTLVETNERTQEKVISTPNSFHTLIQHANGGIRLVSMSNSEAEEQGTTRKPLQPYSSVSTNHVQPRKVAMFHDLHSSSHESQQFHENLEHVNKQISILNTVDSSPVGVPSSISSNYQLHNNPHTVVLESPMLRREAMSSQPYSASGISKEKYQNCSVNSRPGMESTCNPTLQGSGLLRQQELLRVRPNTQLTNHAVQQSSYHPGNFNETNQHSFNNPQHETTHLFHWNNTITTVDNTKAVAERGNGTMQEDLNVSKLRRETFERTTIKNNKTELANKTSQQNVKEQKHSLGESTPTLKTRKGKVEGSQKSEVDWDVFRKQVESHIKRERASEAMDSLDYEALRCADVKKISDTIKERGMNNMLAERIQAFLNRLVKDHGSIDLEWLRDAPPDKAKEYLLSIRGLGLKSVECVRLLTLHHLAFPVDTNVGRIAVRLGWVPLQPLPESLQLHLLEMYPVLESIQKYLWPRLCKLDQRTLYELHYQMITFGKVFCTKSKPNCNACPMRAECRHFASAFASARLALPGPEEKGIVHSSFPIHEGRNPDVVINQVPLLTPGEDIYSRGQCEPIIEVPATPEPECIEISESDIEDAFYEDPDEIPSINLNIEEFTQNLQCYMEENSVVQDGEMSKALVALNSAAASLPTTRLKKVSRLRTEHQVYELPDSHPLLKGLERREPDDPSPYLLAIWTPGETADSAQPPEHKCTAEDPNMLCNVQTCVSCNTMREANLLTVRGTLLIPCRTAMRGSFPLNGTYFQVNEMFADHESSHNPIDVPRAWIWNLPRRTVYFGTSVSTIFKGLTTEGIQYCFWRGFVCVRGFDQKLRTPRPLLARLHLSASQLAKNKK